MPVDEFGRETEWSGTSTSNRQQQYATHHAPQRISDRSPSPQHHHHHRHHPNHRIIRGGPTTDNINNTVTTKNSNRPLQHHHPLDVSSSSGVAVVDNTTIVPRKSASSSRIPRRTQSSTAARSSRSISPPTHYRQHGRSSESHYYHPPQHQHHHHHHHPQQRASAHDFSYASAKDRSDAIPSSYLLQQRLARKYSIDNYVQQPMLCESLWQKQHKAQKEKKQQKQQHKNLLYSSLADLVKEDTTSSTSKKEQEDEENKNYNIIGSTSPRDNNNYNDEGNNHSNEGSPGKYLDHSIHNDDNSNTSVQQEEPVENTTTTTTTESVLPPANDTSSSSSPSSSEVPLNQTIIPMEEQQQPIQQKYGDDDDNNDDQHLLYLKYNQNYCTNVIQCFFNAHLDDEWFRIRYSPYHRVSHTLKDRERAIEEAKIIMDTVQSSNNNKEKFIQQSRLRIGKLSPKSTTTTTTTSILNPKKRKYTQSQKQSYSSETSLHEKGEEQEEEEEQQPQQEPSEEQNHSDEEEVTNENRNTNQCLPKSHLLSSQDPTITLRVTNIPPYVTDAHISNAFDELFRQHPTFTTTVNDSSKGEQYQKAVDRVCSTTVAAATVSASHQRKHKDHYTLDRTAFVVFVNEQAKEYILEKLHKMNLQSTRGTYSLPSAERMTHRNAGGDSHCDMLLEMDVECSDPFNRLEIDYDGKGSAPPPTTTEQQQKQQQRSKSSAEEGSAPKIPIRKAIVLVHGGTEGYHHHRPARTSNILDLQAQEIQQILQLQQVTVLSAAVSSKDLIDENKASALKIAHALDRLKGIPSGFRLEDLIRVIFKDDCEGSMIGEDTLDISIAYLRRVHLFSFYTGQTAKCEGDVLAGTAGTIHLRLEDAEAILMEKERASSTVPDNDNSLQSDMLVQRLNGIITKAVEESTSRLASMDVVVSPEVDSAAEEARKDEFEAKNQWLEDHCVLDADGRARCSFHFCTKLFKDKQFLHKHLLKKHPEYLAGDQAKVHDKYMMQAWEQEEVRPIPRIVVNCGTMFGFKYVPIRGAQPIAEDPEPELFQALTEKRRKDEVMAQLREKQEQQQQQRDEHRWHMKPQIQEKIGFVDVDDMEEEEVKLSLDQVEFPPLNKKKKKKKKLA